MADVLIRDVPDAALAGMDAHAARLGISRAEYIRRRLAADAATANAPVSVEDLPFLRGQVRRPHRRPGDGPRVAVTDWLIHKSALVRAPSIPDLLIAATAELAGLAVLHLDKDFELIAQLTGQHTERLQT